MPLKKGSSPKTISANTFGDTFLVFMDGHYEHSTS